MYIVKSSFIACVALASLATSNPVNIQSTPNPAHIFARQANLSPLFTCPAASWPPTTEGQSNTAQQPSADLSSALSQISPQNIENTILKLVSFGTRHTLSTQDNATYGIGAARDWIQSEFQRYAGASDGRLTVAIESYTQQPDGDRVLFPVVISDVVATLQGTEEPERVYLISGHYDTRCTDPNNYTCYAPGADDDASGVAVSLEVARVLSQPSLPLPRATLKFVAVAGEEQGLYGSTHLATLYRNASVNVEGMFTNDIVGSPRGDPTSNLYDPNTIRLFAQGIPNLATENETTRNTRLTVGGENDTPPRNLARFVAEVAQNDATNMSVAIVYRLDRYLRGGDHRPFLEQGYPAARFTEPHEDFAHQHQDVRFNSDAGRQYGDLPEFVDYEYISRVAKVNAATMWSLGTSPGLPRNVMVNTTELSNDSIFYWDSPVGGEQGNVAGYEVVYRPTDAPFWTAVVDVGLVNQATLRVSKDNVVFGVRARGVNGERGVAEFPFPVA